MEKEFSHLNKKGEANMVDIGLKPVQERVAVASGKIFIQPQTIGLIRNNSIKKGDIFSVARIAGIMAAKKTHDLIPLCHQVQLSSITVDFNTEDEVVKVVATAKCSGRTGVEMEALTAVSASLLTIYDMCKAVDKKMIIGEITLLEKTKQ